MRDYLSWGHNPKVKPARVQRLGWRSDSLDLGKYEEKLLAHGYGRSYGDVCLNDGGVLLDTTAMSRFMAFDENTGLIRCEAGVLLADILELIVPRGWFVPVTPGTKYISVGGAIANDIHGKNHHFAGTFGRYLTQFELLRSDGQHLLCSPTQNVEFFNATIGGLGLTGLILWAEFQLKRIAGPLFDVDHIKFGSLEEFFALSAESDKDFEYTVSWVDCSSRGLGRGIFMRGNHSQQPSPPLKPERKITVPFNFPAILTNGLTAWAFAEIVYTVSQRNKRMHKVIPYQPFFYPLDFALKWYRVYGKRGFYQYQFVVPWNDDYHAIKEITKRIAKSGEGSFIGVLKKFGDIKSPGMLSFPRPGVNLALDFPNNGAKTLKLFESLDEVVRGSGGAVYPAKDARMSAESFNCYFPNWPEFSQYVDPKFSSSFWRRVTATDHGATSK